MVFSVITSFPRISIKFFSISIAFCDSLLNIWHTAMLLLATKFCGFKRKISLSVFWADT